MKVYIVIEYDWMLDEPMITGLYKDDKEAKKVKKDLESSPDFDQMNTISIEEWEV